MTFDAANWDMPEPVTVTGVDTHKVGDNVAYTVNLAAASSDSNYTNLDASVPLTIQNADTASIVVTNFPTTQISEAGGTDQFSVARVSIPSMR